MDPLAAHDLVTKLVDGANRLLHAPLLAGGLLVADIRHQTLKASFGPLRNSRFSDLRLKNNHAL